MNAQRDGAGAACKGQDEARAALARLQVDVIWLAENWERLGVDGCLDHLAGARRDLAAAGRALLRDHLVAVLSGGHMEPGDIQRILELVCRLPDGSPDARSGTEERLHVSDSEHGGPPAGSASGPR